MHVQARLKPERVQTRLRPECIQARLEELLGWELAGAGADLLLSDDQRGVAFVALVADIGVTNLNLKVGWSFDVLIRMGFSEEVSTDGLLATIDAGGIHIEQFDPNQHELPPVDLGPIGLEPVQINQCGVELGCALGASGSAPGALSNLVGAASTRDITSSLRSSGASRWVDLTVANPPAPGSQVRLTLVAGAFEDLFQNPSTDGVVEEFTWGTGETVLLDATPPRVRAVRLLDGHLEIELNEEPDLASAMTAIDVGQPATWALSADGLTLRSEASLLAGDYTLTIQPTLADRAGLNLQQLFELSLLIPAIEPNAVFFEEPDPQEVASSSVGNFYGLHGLPRDPESGLVYARNRYYDPEMGRFITADPLGYVDGPSMYLFAGYSPVNFGDPMGLETSGRERVWWNPLTWLGGSEATAEPKEPIVVKRFYRPIYVRVDPIKSSVAWSEMENEKQLKMANQVFGEQAGVYVFWTRITEDQDPKEALTKEEARALLERGRSRFSAGTGDYEGLPIFFVRETSDNPEEGGSALPFDGPTDLRRSAIVNRYWRGELTNEYVTAHELGHTLGGLCDPTFTTDPRCTFGAPRPEYGGVMNYPSPYYEGAQGEGLSEGEIRRLRKNAQALATRPGGSPP